MLAPVGSVSSSSPIRNTPFNQGNPVASVDAQELQLERQLLAYNQQLAVAQEAARRAEQLQRQIAAVQQQIEQRQLENTRAADLQAQTTQENLAAEQLQADNLQDDQQAAIIAEENLAADRLAQDQLQDDLAADRLAEQRLAADQFLETQDIATEQQIRPPFLDATDTTDTATQTANADETEPAAADNLLPPLTPDDSGRLVNTLV